MSKLATRCSVILIASGLSGLLTGCPQNSAPTLQTVPTITDVKPIPGTSQANIGATPAPGSSLLPFPNGVNPSPGSSIFPGIPTPTPAIPGQLTITTTGLPTGVLNFGYNYALQVASGSGAYRWSVLNGNLPNGLTLDPNTGQIFGRPTQTGTYSFEVQVVDNQKATVARRNMFILISDSGTGLDNLVILSDDLPTGTIDRRYSRNLEISGGAAPFSWDISAGALPDGLTLNSNTGEIAGTPTLKGEETFTVRVTDAKGQVETRTLSITINSTDSDITILTPTLPIGILSNSYNRDACGQSFSGELKATGGDSDYRWEISKGDLPPGLDLDQDSGEITGTPTTNGAYTFTVKLEDGEENGDSRVYTIEVHELAIHSFTPNTGGEDLRVVIFGENLGAADEVRFGNISTTDVSVSTVGDCDQLTTHIPAGAKTGYLSLRSSGTEVGISSVPFIAEHVVIQEVFLSPDDSGNQFVTLKNLGSSSVSIAGWHLMYTNVNDQTEDFTLPSETPPLAAGATTKIKINRDGGTSAAAMYTGSSFDEIRLDPDDLLGLGDVTQVVLCKDDCEDTGTDTSYRDYLQFGNSAGTAEDGTLESEASSSGIWNGSIVDVADLSAALQTVGSTPALTDSAHYGVNESGYDQSGLLVEDGNAEYNGYTDDAVLYYTPSGGAESGQQQRIRRSVTGVGSGTDEDRVRIDDSIFEAQISSSNTGNGTVGNGILVDSVQLFSPNDFVNIITGSTIRTITALASGNKVELDQVLSADVDATNQSDGTVSPGFLVGANQSQIVSGASTVNITVRNDNTSTDRFTVVRNLIATPDADHIQINQALATAPVSATNAGDGTAGFEATVTSMTNFITGDLVLYNGLPCEDGNPCSITIGGSQFRMDQPIAQMQISDANTGDGSISNRIEVDDTTGFSAGNAVLINGQARTIVAITPGFGASLPKIQLSQPLNLTVSTANTGDGIDDGIQVNSPLGFAVGNYVRINGSTRQITAISGNEISLDALVGSTATVDSGQTNNGDGTLTAPLDVDDTTGFVVGDRIRFPDIDQTRTISAIPSGTQLQLDSAITSSTFTTVTLPAGNGTTGLEVNVTDASAFSVGDWVRFANSQIRQIANIAGNAIELNSALPANVSSGTMHRLLDGENITFVPKSGTVLAIGDSGDTDEFTINLVPKSGQFTLVPGQDIAQAMISRIPTSGTIFLAPKNGVLRKYQSLFFNGSANQNNGDYDIDVPSAGQ